jgi:hypothetical protein
VTPEEWEALCGLARQFDEKPRKEVNPPGRSSAKVGGRLRDLFDERTGWKDILEPHGWSYLFTASDGREHWSRPDKEPAGTSATVTPDGQLLYVFSTSTPFDAEKAYSRYAAYAVLNHTNEGGEVDWGMAAREIGHGDSRHSKDEAVTVCLADVEPETVQFLWEDRVPLGKVVIVCGDPGQGKSSVAFDLAARVSSGKKMPLTGVRYEPMSVIVMTAEDGLGDTVVPRLLAAGADLTKIEAITARKGRDGYEAPMSFPEDVDALRAVVDRTDAGLVIIEPLNAFLSGKADSHRDHHVRKALHPLTVMAEETGVAIMIICHLNKSPGGAALYRLGGSIGVAAAARSVLLVAPNPTDPDERILAVIKSNLAAFPQSVVFRLVDEPEYSSLRVKWQGFSLLTGEDLLKSSSNERGRSAQDEAESFLEDVLEDGPIPVTEIKEIAADSGISESTLERAKRSLGIESKRKGFGEGGAWEWSLPDHQPDDVEDLPE